MVERQSQEKTHWFIMKLSMREMLELLGTELQKANLLCRVFEGNQHGTSKRTLLSPEVESS